MITERIARGNVGRVTRLINQTYRFNVTTRRVTEAQVGQLAQASDGWARAFRLRDRTSDDDLVGVLICRANQASHWEIDSCVLSCRALGHQMQRYMFDRLIDAARKRGIVTITGVYRPTPKNALVADCFEQWGFQKSARVAGETWFVLDVSSANAPAVTHSREPSLAGAIA